MSLYLDASVIVPLFRMEPRSELLLDWLGNVEDELIVSELVASEVGATVSRLVRTNLFSVEKAADALEQFDAWRADVTRTFDIAPVDVRLAGRLVHKPEPKLLTLYALHIAACMRTGHILVTYDKDLAFMAGREGVASFQPA